MLRVDQLSRSYGSTLALDQVSFHADAGEVLGFLGPNGAGKSTAMKIITGYIAADAGSVHVDELEVHDHPMETRARIGALPENNPLYEDMEAREYLSFCGQMRGIKGKALREAIERAANDVGLSAMLAKPIRELSRGYRQRTGFAACLLHDPKLLILDEPTSGLDPSQIVEIHELMLKLAGQGKAIVFSTHILSEVQAVAERMVILNRGRVLAQGTPEQITQQAGCEAQARIQLAATASDPLRKRLSKLNAVEKVHVDEHNLITLTLKQGTKPEVGEQLYEVLVEHKAAVRELRIESASLDHAFRELVKKDANKRDPAPAKV